MKTATELAREMPPGPELDALFFETCYPDMPPPAVHDATGETVDVDWPSVTEDGTACDAWAMRWAREKKLRVFIEELSNDRWYAALSEFAADGEFVDSHAGRGTDWKDAFVRVCIAAAEQLNPKGAEHGN